MSAATNPNSDLTAPRDLSQMAVTDPKDGIPHVISAILDVKREIAKTGIAKLRKADAAAGGFAFRGIDDLYNELCGIMVRASLIHVPRFIEHKQAEGRTASGKPMTKTTVVAEYDFYSAKDGSKVTARTFGEGFDMSDKSTNKAMSGADKYCLIQILVLPIVGNDDADAEHIPLGDKNKTEAVKGQAKGVEAKGPKTEGARPALIPEPNGVDPAVTVAAMVKSITSTPDEQKLRAAFAKYQDSIKLWKTYSPKQRKTWLEEITKAKDDRKAQLSSNGGGQPEQQSEART
jgi:hypothetical protein